VRISQYYRSLFASLTPYDLLSTETCDIMSQQESTFDSCTTSLDTV